MTTKQVDDLIQQFVTDLRTALRSEVEAEVLAKVSAALGPAITTKPNGTSDLPSLILSAVAQQPGQRAEDLAGTLHTSAVALRGPIRQLLSGGQLKKRGKARGTKYYLA